MKEIFAILLCLFIGAICSRYAIPLPAPPHWFGVLMISAIWLGYTLTPPAAPVEGVEVESSTIKRDD